jgi:hypothetical protein
MYWKMTLQWLGHNCHFTLSPSLVYLLLSLLLLSRFPRRLKTRMIQTHWKLLFI